MMANQIQIVRVQAASTARLVRAVLAARLEKQKETRGA
jgi:hypothetical protein